MADSMSAAEHRKRLEECAVMLRKIADSKQLGDGTHETWACGIASGLLKEELSELEGRCTCTECRHYERVNGRIIDARCPITGISFLKYGHREGKNCSAISSGKECQRHSCDAPIDPKTFYCKFAERKGGAT